MLIVSNVRSIFDRTKDGEINEEILINYVTQRVQ